MPARIWTKKSVVKQISALYRDGAKLNSRHARKYYQSLYNGANRYCGGWRKAIEMAGIKYTTIRGKAGSKKTWTKKKVVSAIQALYAARLPLNYRAVVTAAEPLMGAAIRRFGSWSKAIAAAGFEYSLIQKKKLRKWSKAQIVIEIIARNEAGLSIKGADVKEQDEGLYIAARRHFGKNGWAHARVSAGFEPIDPRPWIIWTTKSTTEEIKRLHSIGVLLNISSLQKSTYSYVIAAGRSVFGSWAKAVKAAGFDYVVLPSGRQAFWNKARILETIISLEERGTRLNAKNIQPTFEGMFKAACREFGCWSQAVEAAGISYRKHCRIWSTKAWLRRMQPEEYTATLERAQTHARKRRSSK